MLRFQDHLGGWGRSDALDLPTEKIRRLATVSARFDPSGNATAMPTRPRFTFNTGAARAHAEAQPGRS